MNPNVAVQGGRSETRIPPERSSPLARATRALLEHFSSLLRQTWKYHQEVCLSLHDEVIVCGDARSSKTGIASIRRYENRKP